MIEQGKIVSIENDTVTLSCSALSGGCKSCKANSFCSVNGHNFDAINTKNLDLKSNFTGSFAYSKTGNFLHLKVLIGQYLPYKLSNFSTG